VDVTISVYSLNKYLNPKNIYLENVHPESIRSGHCQEEQATAIQVDLFGMPSSP